MTHADDMHTVRNAAAIVLANIEHLSMLLKDADPARPFFLHEDVEQREEALKSVSSAERAARQLVSALRVLQG